jgi:RNA polymerase sigma-70 factor (ECF subfamily)
MSERPKPFERTEAGQPEAGEPDDRQLMARIAARDEGALEQLIGRYQTLVYSLSRRITGQDQDAGDVTAEVFCELWQRPERYNPSKSSPYTYIIMLARCRAIDRKRQLTRQGAHAVLDWLASEPTATPSQNSESNDALVTAEERQLVHRALDGLDAKHREALELAFFEGLTHQGAAEKLGVPLGTIKGRIRRALEQIKQHLQSNFRD